MKTKYLATWKRKWPSTKKVIAIKDEEEEAYDNLPETFQEGGRGEKMQSAMESMEYAIEFLDDIIDAAEGLYGNLMDDVTEILREAIDA